MESSDKKLLLGAVAAALVLFLIFRKPAAKTGPGAAAPPPPGVTGNPTIDAGLAALGGAVAGAAKGIGGGAFDQNPTVKGPAGVVQNPLADPRTQGNNLGVNDPTNSTALEGGVDGAFGPPNDPNAANVTHTDANNVGLGPDQFSPF